jgi:FAD/FMN-containing dehydrogenase
MPIPGYNNINSSGILITSAGLSQLQISADHSTVNVGPGNRWTDVYQYLEQYGLSAVGGRLGVVGVPGYLLGGGVSFFGNEYGWASANIASFTVIEPQSALTG